MQSSPLIDTLLKNRKLVTTSDISEFFSPTHPDNLASPFDSSAAISLVNKHRNSKNKIFIYGDYDVDGICASAILWEVLHSLDSQVTPFIPHRKTDGYGLTKSGIDQCLNSGAKLIIVVDSGIVAHESIDYCRSQGVDCIIIDHHEPSESFPNPNVLLHSTLTSAAGLAWFFCRDLMASHNKPLSKEYLALAGLSVVCDILPLLGVNRSFAKHGLFEMKRTLRPGLLALFSKAGLSLEDPNFYLTAYHFGFVIGPRLNAMGRLAGAMDSLRLICTKDPQRAESLAELLESTNRTRQELTQSALTHALNQKYSENIIVTSDSSYDEGVIGLVAAKLTEKYHRPSIVISVGKTISKGSARSISGFNITEHLRLSSSLLESVGGHTMAAGFSLKTSQLDKFITSVVTSDISSDLLIKKQRIDATVPIGQMSDSLYTEIQRFEPFGLGNPTPVFLSSGVLVSGAKTIGQKNNHLKFRAGSIEAIYFNVPDDLVSDFNEPVDIYYQLDKNVFNGRTNLQLKVVGIKYTHGSTP